MPATASSGPALLPPTPPSRYDEPSASILELAAFGEDGDEDEGL